MVNSLQKLLMTFEMGAQAVQGGLESAKLVFHILVMVTCNCRTEAADMPSMSSPCV